jgi:hypothetical protein
MIDDDSNSPIDRALGLSSMHQSTAVSTILAKVHDDSAKEDFTFARANIREVVENANDAIAKLAIIADQSQDPRTFDVLSNMMNTVVTASKHLLEIQKDIRAIEKPDVPNSDQGKQQVTNNLYVGSTAELAKVIAQLRKES